MASQAATYLTIISKVSQAQKKTLWDLSLIEHL